MIRLWRTPKIFFAVCIGSAAAGGTVLYYLSQQLGWFPAMSLTPAANKFPGETQFQPDDVAQLLVALPFEPLSSATGPVLEPALPTNAPVPTDLDKLGRNQSRFVVANKWATIRYLGANPAGAGLTGTALDKAQTDALGAENDTIPVVTAAVTISNMMENFYAPLLNSFPEGQAVLPQIYVQGAYFSPTYRTSAGNVGTDNAYIVGLQSLYLFPSSCFFKAKEGECAKKFFSTGHDPTVVGHELGHVVFNQLRKSKGFEGFQWFAANEGYADYFSAAYFSEPLIGRIWKVTRQGQTHLRRLLDNTKTTDLNALQEAHKFSVVWSSTLWRMRNRLQAELKISPGEIDRMVLRSVLFLGNTVNPRLGDAGAALMQSATSYKLDAWIPIIQQELNNGAINTADNGAFSLPRRGGDIVTETPLSGARANCGVVAGSKTADGCIATLFLFFAPLLMLIFARLKSRSEAFKLKFRGLKLLRFSFLVIVFSLLGGCKYFSKSGSTNTSRPPPPGPTLVYKCFPGLVDSSVPSELGGGSTGFDLHLAWLAKPAGSSADSQLVLASDDRYELAPSAVIFVFDFARARVDQVRNRDGRALELDVNARSVSWDEAEILRNMKYGKLILENAQQAIKTNAAGSSSADFTVDGTKYSAGAPKVLLPAALSFGPMATVVAVTTSANKSQNICQFSGSK